MFGYKTHNPICQKPNTAHQRKQLIPASKHGGGRWMIWAFSAATGPERPAATELTMKSSARSHSGGVTS